MKFGNCRGWALGYKSLVIADEYKCLKGMQQSMEGMGNASEKYSGEYGSVCRIDKPFMGNQFADFGVRAYV